MKDTIKAIIRHPRKKDVLTVELPLSTKVNQLQKIVVDAGYARPYVMGFKFIISKHLLTDGAAISNYVPEGAEEVVIDIFDIPETTI